MKKYFIYALCMVVMIVAHPTPSSAQLAGAVCGPANSTTVATKPTVATDLCGIGTPTEPQGAGPWTWDCNGAGVVAHCSANKIPDGSPVEPTDDPMSFLQNPFKDLDTFPKIFAAVYNNIVLPVAVPFVALAVMYSGFLFIINKKAGNVDGIKRAKDTFKYTMIGAALLLGGFVIANALQQTLKDLLGFASVDITHLV